MSSRVKRTSAKRDPARRGPVKRGPVKRDPVKRGPVRRDPVKRASRLKDPKGGLTEKGREWFRSKQGAHLKPGVKTSRAKMTPQEMRRKGSWAVRFYGRKGTLPPLKKPDGSPTRLALTAQGGGEPIPKTGAAARKIPAKGRRLLEAYARARATAR